MASGNRAPQRDEVERRYAARLVERRRLSPPIDVHDVVGRYARIEYDSIPADCDAVVLRPTADRETPLVIVNRDRPERRQRFSLAHELGHIIIPWHIFATFCHTELWDSEQDYGYRRSEGEANRFASELLMPSRWLRAIVSASPSATEVFNEAAVANVSASAASIAITRQLPPGHVVVLLDSSGAVETVQRSPDTDAPVPLRNRPLDPTTLDRFSSAHAQLVFSGRLIRWWRFDPEVSFDDTDSYPSSRETLQMILDEVVPDPTAQSRAKAQVAGVAGAAKSQAKVRTRASLSGHLRKRFSGRPDLAPITTHPLFEQYLAAKSREMSD